MNNKFTMLSRDKRLIKRKRWSLWAEFTTYNWKFIPTIELDLYAGYVSVQFLCFAIKVATL